MSRAVQTVRDFCVSPLTKPCFTSKLMKNKGLEKEEYMRIPLSERTAHGLRGSFREEVWKVALEPEC